MNAEATKNASEPMLLEWIKTIDGYRREHGIGPSSQDLARAWGLSRAAVMHRLRALRDLKYVGWSPASVRSLVITPKGRAFIRRMEAELASGPPPVFRRRGRVQAKAEEGTTTNG